MYFLFVLLVIIVTMQPALDDKEEDGINHEIARLEKGLFEQVILPDIIQIILFVG